jgi:hypothetical protein
MAINAPGIYAINAAEYHADPVEQPSLSASIATILVQQSALHAKWAHPRLVDNPTREEARAMDIGSICHALILEGENVSVVIEAENYRTKAAQEARDAARLAGKFPILAKEMEDVREMMGACLNQLAVHEEALVRDAFKLGRPEQTLVWREPNGVWCRMRADWIHSSYPVIYDYKTSGRSAHPQNISRIAAANGWCLQEAFYRRGFKAVFGQDHEPDFFFVCQENYRPYALTVFEVSPQDRALADHQVEYAILTWRECLSNDRWPAYSDHVERITSPPYVESSWMEREA